MPRVTRSADTRADLAGIWDTIAENSLQRATAFLGELEGLFQTLADQPLMGGPCPELGEDVRSFPVARYVVYYQPWPDGVDIVCVLHAARDVARLSG